MHSLEVSHQWIFLCEYSLENFSSVHGKGVNGSKMTSFPRETLSLAMFDTCKYFDISHAKNTIQDGGNFSHGSYSK